MCIRQRESGYIEPKGIIKNPLRITDTAPLERWHINLLDVEGKKRVREIVAPINEMCPELCPGWLATLFKIGKILLIFLEDSE